MACVTATSGMLLPFVWITPSAEDLALLVALGLIGGIAQLFLTRAFEFAPPAVVMPFEYLSLVFTAFLAWTIWTETLGAMTLAGAGIVIASGLFILRREAARARREPPSGR